MKTTDCEINSKTKDLRASLKWQDFSALATWLAEEISGNYYMDKKSYKKQRPNEPFHFSFRQPVRLCHEETTLLAIFIKQIFWEYWRTGKTSDFDWQKKLRHFAWQLGMRGYENNRDLRALCWQFTEKFSAFLKTIKDVD